MANPKHAVDDHKAKEIIRDPTAYGASEEIRTQELMDVKRRLGTLGALETRDRQDIQGNKAKLRQMEKSIEYLGSFVPGVSANYTGSLASNAEAGAEPAGDEKWAARTSIYFDSIRERVEDLESIESTDDIILQIDYCMAELEVWLAKVEECARFLGMKYEGRLASSLRHVCMLYEPDEISEEQAKQFAACVRNLMSKWGTLDRETVSSIRSKVLDAGLTWLPVTTRAQREIEEAKRAKAAADGQSECAG